MELISYAAVSINYYVCVCILAFIIQRANHIFSVSHYIVICDVCGSAIFFIIIS